MAEANLTHVEQLADQLSFEEQLSLVEHLAHRLRQTVQQRQPQDLYGLWRDRFPLDFDLDVALHDIRRAWECRGIQGSKP